MDHRGSKSFVKCAGVGGEEGYEGVDSGDRPGDVISRGIGRPKTWDGMRLNRQAVLGTSRGRDVDPSRVWQVYLCKAEGNRKSALPL